MAAFHLRNIPDELYSRLKERARSNGRSVNAEIRSILEGELARPTRDDFMQRLDELHARWKVSPDSPAPEDLIREARDSR